MREKLIELFKQEHERCQNTPCDECIYDNAADCGVDALVDYLIANDVVQVVRCKDCMWFDTEDELADVFNKERHCFCTEVNTYVSENGFCSYGERKDND